MKILWIVNTIFPYSTEKLGYKKSVFGGWLNSLFESLNLENDIKIAVVTTYNGKEFKRFENGKNIYYLLPCKKNTIYNKHLEDYYKKIINDYNPDLVHIHGTEYPSALAFLNCNFNIKTITSIQGLISSYSKVYTANICEKDIKKSITFRDMIKRTSILKGKKDFEKRGLYEKEILKKTDCVIGRTTWDYANTFAITNEKKYSFCNESLRETFYTETWNSNNFNKHTIYISQGSYPIKGLHVFLESLKILKEKYPDVKVYVAGQDITNTKTLKNKLKITGYGNYIKKTINKYNLNENIIFTGLLTEQEVAKYLKNINVFVQTSSIENSPNSLGEAMLMGVPCVASNVGGTSDMLIDKEEGLLFPFPDTKLMAYYISLFFEDKNLCKKLGNNARKHALKTHDRKTNTKQMLKIYNDVLNQSI